HVLEGVWREYVAGRSHWRQYTNAGAIHNVLSNRVRVAETSARSAIVQAYSGIVTAADCVALYSVVVAAYVDAIIIDRAHKLVIRDSEVCPLVHRNCAVGISDGVTGNSHIRRARDLDSTITIRVIPECVSRIDKVHDR